MKKRVAVLGATGSIGKSSIDIIARNNKDPEKKIDFEVVLLCAHSGGGKLKELSRQFPGAVCVLTKEDGTEKLLNAIKNSKADIVLNGISGAAGLKPSLAAIEAGCDLALANKETIVMAGNLVLKKAKEKKVNIIPVDSEHSAIFHLLQYFNKEQLTWNNEQGIVNNKKPDGLPVSEIILTASGGPFRNYTHAEMRNVTIEDALSHPTWKMGAKITIDSASMANKGLEVIEACNFFNMPPEKIKVVIHPQSIVHSMIRLYSGVCYAQLSNPDMRHPIHDALFFPETSPCALEPLNFDSLTLEFFKPDVQKFPMLNMAFEAAKRGNLYPCAYNAANETAVAAFLEKKIGFLDIPKITENVLQADWSEDCSTLEGILNADSEARKKAALSLK